MRLLLIAANRERFPKPVAPLGAACIAASARLLGHEVELLDLLFADEPDVTVGRVMKSFRPDLVGISFRNLDNSSCFSIKSYLADLEETVTAVRKYQDVPIVLGGAGFTCSPQAILRRFDVPYGIVGEGEAAICHLLDELEAGRTISSGNGILTSSGTQPATFHPCSEPVDLNSLPMPAHDLIDYGHYQRLGGHAGIQTKRGCGFCCRYCSYPVIEGTRYRFRDPILVVDEIEKLHKDRDIHYFYFADSVFSFPREQAQGICEEILRRNLKIHWEAMTNPRAITEELVSVMKRSGCIGVEFGADSGSEQMLVNLGKKFTTEDIVKAATLYRQYHIPFAVFLMLGGPGETPMTIRESMDFYSRIPAPTHVFFNFGVRIYAGTPLAHIAKQEGVIAPDDDLMEPKIYLSPELSFGFLRTMDYMCRRHWSWSTAYDWSSPLTARMMLLGQLFRTRPAWKFSGFMGLTRLLRQTFSRQRNITAI